MQDLHFQRALDALEDSGLELLTEDRKVLAAAPVAAREHLVNLLVRAMSAGNPTTPTPATVVRYRPPTCNERLDAGYAPATGRHAKGGRDG